MVITGNNIFYFGYEQHHRGRNSTTQPPFDEIWVSNGDQIIRTIRVYPAPESDSYVLRRSNPQLKVARLKGGVENNWPEYKLYGLSGSDSEHECAKPPFGHFKLVMETTEYFKYRGDLLIEFCGDKINGSTDRNVRVDATIADR